MIILDDGSKGGHSKMGSAFATLLVLANPFRPVEPLAIQEGLKRWMELIRLADTNRTLLLLHNNLKVRRDMIPDYSWNRLEEQAILRLFVWNLILDEISKIKLVLQGSGIRWMLVKTIRALPREVRDLDMLVLGNKFRAFSEALAPLGYVQSGKVSGFKMELKTYRCLRNGRKVPVAIDVHSRISYEGLSFLDEEATWNQRRTVAVDGTSVSIPSREHQLATCVLNSFFGDGGLRLGDVFEFGKLVGDGAETSAVRRIASEYGWVAAYDLFVEKSSRYLSLLKDKASTARSDSNPRLPELPAPFDRNSLLKGLLDKATYDLGRGGKTLVPSWGRIAMKFASKLGRDHIRNDTWNDIFTR